MREILRRAVACLALSAFFPACVTQALGDRAAGRRNGILVYRVQSLDAAWFVPEKGLVICGQVEPGVHPRHGTSGFAAPIRLSDLRRTAPSRAPLGFDRLYEAPGGDCRCAARLPLAREVPVTPPGPGVSLVNFDNPQHLEVVLEAQRLHIDALPGITESPVDLTFGPRGKQPFLWPLVVPAVIADVGFFGGMVGAAALMAALAPLGLVYWGVRRLVVGPEEPKLAQSPVPPEPCANFATKMFPAE